MKAIYYKHFQRLEIPEINRVYEGLPMSEDFNEEPVIKSLLKYVLAFRPEIKLEVEISNDKVIKL